MLLGVLLLMGTGLVWAFIGGLISYTARNNVNLVLLQCTQVVMTMIITFTIFPDYHMLSHGISSSTLILVGILLVAGSLNALATLTVQRAMRTGHQGVVWSISQSALVIPFLAGVLFFGEKLSLLHVTGIVLLLISLAAFGFAKNNTKEEYPKEEFKKSPSWFFFALLALSIYGVQQTLMTMPSHLLSLTDSAHIRIPLISLGNGLVYFSIWGKRPVLPTKHIFLLAAFTSLVSITSSFCLFTGLDKLAQSGMASVGFPICVGTCISGFAIYSILVLREKCTWIHIAGILLGLMGVVCVSMR
jgi:drug/metabolite transporter (DMT)-like permease